MALLVRIYFNAVFGALGGLLGWLVFGIFGDKSSSTQGQWLLGGAIIGGSIGYFVVSVEAIRDRSLIRFCRLASYGVVLGLAGGALGMLAGEWINDGGLGLLGQVKLGTGLSLLATILVRGFGWMCLGLAIGVSEGIAARSLGKLSYGILGGMLGGFVGGALFGLVYESIGKGATTNTWSVLGSALGLVILGASIGSLSAFVQGVLQPASVKVLRGWQEGREYALLKAETLVGREEHADIALFRDMKVEKRHALIKRKGNHFVLWNNGAPTEHTLVNDYPVAHSQELKDGDRIQLGNVLLRFQLRAAQGRHGRAAVRGQKSAVSSQKSEA